MTVEELLDRMTSREVTEWVAEFQIRGIEAAQARARSSSL